MRESRRGSGTASGRRVGPGEEKSRTGAAQTISWWRMAGFWGRRRIAVDPTVHSVIALGDS